MEISEPKSREGAPPLTAYPGPSEPGRCAYCGERFPLDERGGEYVAPCPCRRAGPFPCELDGVPVRRRP